MANFSQTVETAQSFNIPQNCIVLFQIYDYCNCTIKYFTFWFLDSLIPWFLDSYAESWSILINIDQYWSILIRTLVYQSHGFCFKTTNMPISDQYWSILINIDSHWSILINIDQDFCLPKSRILFQNSYYAESWSILINIDQYWSISIRTIVCQSHGICFKTTYMPIPDQYWSILINIDLYWSILINIDHDFCLPKSRILFQNS